MSADDKELSESLRQTFKKGDLIVCRGVIRTVIKRYYIGNGHFVLDVEDANGGIEPVSESTCEAYVHQPESVTNAPDLAAAELEKITKLLDDCGFIGGVSVLARVRELMRRHATNNAEVWKGLAERLTVAALRLARDVGRSSESTGGHQVNDTTHCEVTTKRLEAIK